MGLAFIRALEPDAVAKAAVAHLVKEVGDVKPSAGKAEPAKDSAGSRVDAASAAAKPTKQPTGQELKIEARIYGEVRDSMVPLVALVSILTVAIVVILGTFLKAAFLGHGHGQVDTKSSDSSPVPIIEALKSLAESIKALFKN